MHVIFCNYVNVHVHVGVIFCSFLQSIQESLSQWKGMQTFITGGIYVQ